MRGLLLLMLAGLVAFGAEDEWAKVKALKTGAELRVYKKGAAQPISAQMDELTDESLVVIVKKTQTAIPKDQIDRIDARPGGGSRVTKETTNKENFPDSKAAADAGSAGPAMPSTSTSTSVSMGSKPDFEMVYRRPIGAPKK
jgi:hypothetical protein